MVVVVAVVMMRDEGREGRVRDLEEEAGVRGGVEGGVGRGGVRGGVGAGAGAGAVGGRQVRDEEGAEEGLQGEEEEVGATTKAGAVKGEGAAEEAGEGEVEVRGLLRGVGVGASGGGVGPGAGGGGGDNGKGLVDVVLGYCARLEGGGAGISLPSLVMVLVSMDFHRTHRQEFPTQLRHGPEEAICFFRAIHGCTCKGIQRMTSFISTSETSDHDVHATGVLVSIIASYTSSFRASEDSSKSHSICILWRQLTTSFLS